MGETCRICGNAAGNSTHVASEKMFGLGGAFTYLECHGCGCLQLLDVPDDLSRYYPPRYYSLAESDPVLPGWLGRLLRQVRSELALRGGSRAARALFGGEPPPWTAWLGGRANTVSRILDFGSGAGYLLLELHKQGFRRLAGVDAFIEREIDYAPDLRIHRRLVPALAVDGFDLVMLHHSFEHLPDPKGLLTELAGVLRPGGTLLIRTPVADSWGWRHYGTNWVQLDPPRHVFVHTRASLEFLAGRAGLVVEDVVHDSSAFQFWGSEQYLRGIPLRDPRSYAENPTASIFFAADIAHFEHRAEELNEAGEGDQACFYLARREPTQPHPAVAGSEAVRRGLDLD